MDENTKFLKEKETFTKEIKKLVKLEDIVNEYFRRHISFNKYYPEIKNFDEYLATFKPKLPELKKAKILALYKYNFEKNKNSDNNGNISNYYAPDFLNINAKLFKKLLDKGFIKPTGYYEFRKWGKTLETPYFDYDYLYKIKKEKLDDMIINLDGFKNSDDQDNWLELVTEINNKYSLILNNNIFYKPIFLETINKTILEKVDLKLTKYNFKELEINKLYLKIEQTLEKTKNKEQTIINKFNYIIKNNLLEQEEIKELKNFDNNLKKEKFFKELDGFIEKINYKRNLKKIEIELDLKNYHKSFTLARSMKRKVNFVIGPTNSGKTFQALESLMKSKTGIYLAPLRLMALEAYEKLNDAGIPCNLITGEEKIIVENAKHTSSTIECLNVNEMFDCAIIDEIQMINDNQRGWAWTKALVGLASKEIFCIGNKAALNKSVELIAKLNDDYEIFHKNRLSKLNTISKPVNIANLKKGDALIAFSKKQVLRYAFDLRKKGRSVSVIYGALSPEVRKKQAHLFLEGKNDILVSTDAIGMGLNLPLNRVIFSSLEKYDGIQNRILNHTEVKQISGRAGRFNSDGFVGILSSYNKLNSNFLDKNLLKAEKDILKFPIIANKWHVSKIKEILETDSIEEILSVFPDLCTSNDYYGIYNEDILELAKIVDKKLNIEATEKLKFCLAPIDIKSNRQLEYFCGVLNKAFIKEEEIKFPKYGNFNKKGTFQDLTSAEEELKCMTLFKYLANFSDKINLEGIEGRKKFLEEFIFKTLLTVKVPEYKEYRDDFFEYFF